MRDDDASLGVTWERLVLSFVPVACWLQQAAATNKFVKRAKLRNKIAGTGVIAEIPLVWSAWEWTIDLDVLEWLVARDAETHDAVRMAFLMLGVAHASITWRGTRQQNVWIGGSVLPAQLAQAWARH